MDGMKYNRRTVGKNLQSVRHACGLTQEAASEAAGCSLRHLINIEGGRCGLSIDTLLSLSKIYHITPNDILLIREDDYTELTGIRALLEQLPGIERERAYAILVAFTQSFTSHNK